MIYLKRACTLNSITRANKEVGTMKHILFLIIPTLFLLSGCGDLGEDSEAEKAAAVAAEQERIRLTAISNFVSRMQQDGIRVNPDTGELQGDTALHRATVNSDKDEIARLLHKNANVNTVDGLKNTPLHIAIVQSDEEIIELLINRGADVHLKNRNGKSSLDLAREDYVSDRILELLEDKGKGFFEKFLGD